MRRQGRIVDWSLLALAVAALYFAIPFARGLVLAAIHARGGWLAGRRKRGKSGLRAWQAVARLAECVKQGSDLRTVASLWDVDSQTVQTVLRRIWPGGSRSAGNGWFFSASSICLP